MAALSRPAHVTIRAAHPGEGPAIASLWRELWDAHEAWGGYPGSRDVRVYAQLGHRLDEDARVRGGHPILGRHIHLVADLGGVPCGQVEGWFEKHGVDPATPYTCEVRSLIVTERARGLGAGKLLLDELAGTARLLARGAPCVLAAEVLDANPAVAFYRRVGYATGSYNARIESSRPPRALGTCTARIALPRDAHALAFLESTLAARRRSTGDTRFDRPRAVDATLVGAIAAHLATDGSGKAREPSTLVAIDADGVVRASAAFTTHTLEPPFIPMRRALLGRVAIDPACGAAPLLTPLLTLACRLASSQGAARVELTDLPRPGSDLHAAAIADGATPWSTVVLKPA
jgi:GNAT superfamily N-acetyltransferase